MKRIIMAAATLSVLAFCAPASAMPVAKAPLSISNNDVGVIQIRHRGYSRGHYRSRTSRGYGYGPRYGYRGGYGRSYGYGGDYDRGYGYGDDRGYGYGGGYGGGPSIGFSFGGF
jgi:hypothetical protein